MNRSSASSFIPGLIVVLLCLMSFDATAQAQLEARRVRYDTGVLTLSSGDQFLRVTIDWGDGGGTGAVIRFRKVGYLEQDNVYKVVSEVTTDPMTLDSSEAVHIDISQGEFSAVRGVVIVSGAKKDAAEPRVTVQIISRSTGRVESVLVALLLP